MVAGCFALLQCRIREASKVYLIHRDLLMKVRPNGKPVIDDTIPGEQYMAH
jgi:hypothetical protein